MTATSSAVVLSAVLVSAMIVSACGIARRGVVGEQCDKNSQCDAPLVCRIGRCRIECRSSEDCIAPAACVQDDAGHGACQVDEERACALASDCTAPLMCVDANCVNQCATEVDCPPGARCIEGACIEPAVTPCAYSSECNAEELCLRGRCRPQCHADRDCDNDFRCAHPPNLRGVDGVCAPIGSPLLDGAPFDGGPRFVSVVDSGPRMDGGMSLDGAMAADGGAMTDGGTLDATATTDGGVVDSGGPPCIPGTTLSIAFRSIVGGISEGGPGHFCGVTTDDRVACWGGNTAGELGRGTTGTYGPMGFVSGVTDAAEVVVGSSVTCVRHATGAVSCFGADDQGQLGNGGTATPSSTPTPVTGLTDATSLSAGRARICATRPAARPVCWGEDQRVGAPWTTPMAEPTLPVGATIVAVAEDATCAVLAGQATCMRSNGTATPDVVGPGAAVTNFVALSAGQQTFCGIRASVPDRTVYCFGDNTYGQLGNMTVGGADWTGADILLLVGSPPSTAAQLVLGGRHACWLDMRGFVDDLICWGDNSAGQQQVPSGMPVSAPRSPLSVVWAAADTLGASASATCIGSSTDFDLRCQGTLSLGDATGDVMERGSTSIHNCP